MEFQELIESLGFSEKEASVYLALLRRGATSAYVVAVASGLKRPTTYVILDELVRRGAAILVPRTKKKLYRAVPPENILEKAQQRLARVEEALPKIKALEKVGTEKPQVLFFEGVGGTKEALHYGMNTLDGKEIVGFYARTSPEVMEVFDGYADYLEELKKRGVYMQGIVPNDPSLASFRAKDKEYGREFVETDEKEYSSDIAVEIGPTFVRFFDPLNLQGLVIENPAITKTMRQIFEMLWKRLK